jgi:hypothetical protein
MGAGILEICGRILIQRKENEMITKKHNRKQNTPKHTTQNQGLAIKEQIGELFSLFKKTNYKLDAMKDWMDTAAGYEGWDSCNFKKG